MCQSRAEGGRRCYAHQRQRVDELEQELAQAPPDTPEHDEAAQRLATAREGLLETRTGLQDHISTHLSDGGPYDAEQLTEHINRYIGDSPNGRGLTLPGGPFRVLRAHTSGGHTVLEVAGTTSARTFNKGLRERYDEDEVGKQVTRASAKELQEDFATLLVLADGRAGAGIRHTGEIASVYSNSNATKVVQAILPLAVKHGGTHLECFNTFLPKLYARSGFVPVASIPFNREFAPEGWDYSVMSRVAPPRGEPDVVFMVSKEQYENLGCPAIREFSDYDEADEYTRTGRTS